MRAHVRFAVCLGLAVGAFAAAATAEAKPAIRLMPANAARFLSDQYFDVRVEYTPTTGQTLTNVTLSIDGAPQTIAVASLDANNGFTLRNYSSTAAGQHTITATATESGDGAVTTQSVNYEIVDPTGPNRRYRNVIILLGDGMGAGHRTAARIVRYGYTNGHPNGRLAMDEFPVSGMIMTSSLNSIVTDSAPGMACYSTGSKAFNNQEGVYPDNTTEAFDNPRVEYLGEYMKRKFGKSLGIVTTADVEDATPAANAVHTANRNAGTGVCDQYLDENALPNNRGNGLAVLLGGGRRWFLPAAQFGSSRANSTDYQLTPTVAQQMGVPAGALDPQRDLIADFQAQGFTYAATNTDLTAAVANSNTTKLLGLFAYGNMNVAYDKIAKRRNPGAPGVIDDYHAPDQPMLDEMASAALSVLSRNPNGFVLTIEGAHIDKQSHTMDADRAIWDTIEFDNAVRKAREFAEADRNTLVIVLADHECSGFNVIGALTKTNAEMQALPSDNSNFAPASAGNPAPQRQAAVGTYDAAGFPQYPIAADGYPVTADIDKRIVVGFGASADRYEGWIAKPTPTIDSLLPTAIRTEMSTGATATGTTYPAEAINRPESAFGFFIRGQAPGLQAVHTATDIPVTVFGGRAAMTFTGYQENIDIFFKLASALSGGI